MVKWRDLSQAGLFGLIDGLNGMVGLVIGLSHAHAAANIIFIALLARAGSSSISMAGAQYQADDTSPNNKVRWGRVIMMGCGYLTSALVPGLGFALSTSTGFIFFIPATIAVLSCITWFRAGKIGWPKAAATTLIIFLLAVAAGLLASLAG